MKKVNNFSRYSLDESGNIYSDNYKNSGKQVRLKPAKSNDGYLKTMIQDDSGKYHTVAVHRLVALAYFGEKQKGQEVNHKNGNKEDNSLNNLEYCTRSQNCQHSFDMGLQKPKRGSLNGMSKITEDQVREIREYVANFKGRYYGRKQLASQYGISESHLKDIVNKRRNIWPHIQ
jgi:hypothetical protein